MSSLLPKAASASPKILRASQMRALAPSSSAKASCGKRTWPQRHADFLVAKCDSTLRNSDETNFIPPPPRGEVGEPSNLESVQTTREPGGGAHSPHPKLRR